MNVPRNTGSEVTEWWHLFLSENDAMGAIVTTIFGESTQSPTKAAETARAFDPPIYHIHSFDHEPDEDEVDSTIKENLLRQIENERQKARERAAKSRRTYDSTSYEVQQPEAVSEAKAVAVLKNSRSKNRGRKTCSCD